MKEIESSGFLKKGLMEQLPFLEEVYQETIALDRPFQEIAALFADDTGTVLLLSGSNLDCSRYNILAVKPWLELVSKHKSVSIKYQGRAFEVQQDPFSLIQALLDRFKFNNDESDLPLLADYKTLNYLYYERAGQFAKDHQGDEAIILNPDFTISETNTASISAIKDKTVMVPESIHVLDGVTIKSVLTILSHKGYDICKKPVPKEQFYLYPNIIVTNALMGAVKVLSVDKTRIEHEKGVCSMINEQLFNF